MGCVVTRLRVRREVLWERSKKEEGGKKGEGGQTVMKGKREGAPVVHSSQLFPISLWLAPDQGIGPKGARNGPRREGPDQAISLVADF